jgi:hypothetical protein
MKDFNVSNDLKDSYKFKVTEIQKTLENLIFRIIETSNQGMIGKTLIACKNTDQANIVYKYLKDKNIKTELSTSEFDKDSEAIRYFEEDSSSQVLVVVYRGVLGFNMPELANVIDFTFSQNIDRIFQLMARVFRKSESVKTKYFYKVSSISLEFYYQQIMNATLSLSQIEYLSLYNGKNFGEMPVIHEKSKIKTIESNKFKIKRKVPIPIEFKELTGLEVFETVKNHDTIYAMSKIGEIKSKIFNNNVERTDKDIIESGKGFGCYKDWAANNKTYVGVANERGILVEMREKYNWGKSPKTKHSYSTSEIYDSAIQCKDMADWRNKDFNKSQLVYDHKIKSSIAFLMILKNDKSKISADVKQILTEKMNTYKTIENLKKCDPVLFEAAKMFNLLIDLL